MSTIMDELVGGGEDVVEINASELQRRCFEILRDVRRNRKRVTVLWRGEEVAELVPVNSGERDDHESVEF